MTDEHDLTESPDDPAEQTFEPEWAQEPDGGALWADDDAAEAADQSPAQRPHDPLVNVLLIGTMSLIVVLLGTTAALFFWLSALNKAPRTLAERDVVAWETAVREKPSDANSWASLSYAYAAAGRYDDALDTIRKGEKVTDQPSMVLIEADVLRAAGRFKEAVGKYNSAEKAIAETERQLDAKRRKAGVSVKIEDGALVRVFLGRGLAEYELGDLDAAIKDLEKAVAEQPEQASTLVTLGDYYVEKGEKAKAEKVYRDALTYVPDYKEALDGLKRLKEGK